MSIFDRLGIGFGNRCGSGFGNGIGCNSEILFFIILFLLLFCNNGFNDNDCGCREDEK